ncbi:unnamed protein product [Onchocerca ochengi]|uniref:UPF0020 domain-containing protein n=1 Tax=Onchocerca ochengi TaxID=42157 RepID=A0A182EDK1_ONCOC|nr:unnamed protein product [Onchocerca ochengi]
MSGQALERVNKLWDVQMGLGTVFECIGWVAKKWKCLGMSPKPWFSDPRKMDFVPGIKMGLAGMIAAGTVATSAITVTALCVPFVTPALRKICIPYVPATPQQLQNVATALTVCPTKVSPLVDLGSGDGRVFLFYVHIQQQCKQYSTLNY